MYFHETQIRVRYSETDQMGYVYYGHYAQYYEVGRTELMRKFGLTYRNIEESGIILPVQSMTIKYLTPARYDDLLTIKTFINQLPSVRIKFDYEVYNEENILLNTGDVTLVFVDAITRKPRRPPEKFLKQIVVYF